MRTTSSTESLFFAKRMYISPQQANLLRYIYIILFSIATVVPIINICFIIASTGANNVSSDDYLFVTRLVDPIFNGEYNWLHFFKDSFFNTHAFVFPSILYLLDAYFFQLNEYVLLFVGILLAFVRLCLLHDAFTRNRKSNWSWWFLWPFLAALIFSTSQISLFEHGPTSTTTNLCQFGVALGIWGLSRFQNRITGIWIMSLGGIIATLSFGSGLAVWPTFLLGLLLLRYRRFSYYLLWFGAAFLSATPYIIFLVLQHQSTSETAIGSVLNIPVILQLIGLPLAQNFDLTIATTSGIIGVVLAIIGLCLLIAHKRRDTLTYSVPSIMLIAFSLVNVWQVSIFRGRVAPWYTFIGANFWVGLLGLTFVLWTSYSDTPVKKGLISRSLPVWVVSVIVATSALYARSDITYRDKSLFLMTRSPASAACIRNYHTAPSYCEKTLVIWPIGKPEYLPSLAEPLERHHLSVFASQQEWALQGDFILDSVHTHETPGIPDIIWSTDETPIPVSWTDWRHLNLFLHAPNSISWTFTLPSNLQDATFSSAAILSPAAPHSAQADGVTFETYIQGPGHDKKLAFGQKVSADERNWHPFTIPLSEYAGKTITIQLTSDSGGNVIYDWVMYRYPHIDMQLNQQQPNTVQEDGIPFTPVTTPSDAVFALNNPGWQVSDLQPVTAGATTWRVGQNPFLQYVQPLNLCLADYSHFLVRMAASPEFSPRAMKLFYKLDPQAGFNDYQSVQIPLVSDGTMYTYTYDLKLLELSQDVQLRGIRLMPVGQPASFGPNQVQIEDIRLIRNSEPHGCASTR